MEAQEKQQTKGHKSHNQILTRELHKKIDQK
jgi:hypothetical protein